MVRKSRSGLRRVGTVTLCTAFWCAAAVGLIAKAQQSAPSYEALRQGFQSPPEQAKLWCYWWWLNGNTTKETITRDLTEMSRKGFGGVLLVDANGSDENGNADTPAGPRFASPEWTALYVHALQVASQLHLKVLLNATSGWNTGGPDVKPAEAAKLLTWSRVQVDAKGFDGTLPMPAVQNGFYQQIAVLAYPLTHGAALPGTDGDGRAPIRDLEPKTAAVELGFSMPPTDFLLTDNAAQAGEQDTTLDRVVNSGECFQISEEIFQIGVAHVAQVHPRHNRAQLARAHVAGAHDVEKERFVVVRDPAHILSDVGCGYGTVALAHDIAAGEFEPGDRRAHSSAGRVAAFTIADLRKVSTAGDGRGQVWIRHRGVEWFRKNIEYYGKRKWCSCLRQPFRNGLDAT